MRTALAVLALACALAPARAQMGEDRAGRWSGDQAMAKVDFAPRPGAALPPALSFTDSDGRAVRLADYLGRGPLLLQLVYYKCPSLCPMAEDGLLRALRAISLSPGADFQALTVSIDPAETPGDAAYRKKLFVGRYRRPGAQAALHYLVGKQPAVAALARAVGFRYAYDSSSGQFAHTTGVLVLTADGRVSRYLPGIEPSAADLRLALVEASEGRIGTFADRFILLCYHYDPTTGRYGPTIMTTLRLLGVLTLLGIAALVGGLSLRARAARARSPR